MQRKRGIRNKNNGLSKGVWLGIIVLLVAVLAVAVYFAFFDKGKVLFEPPVGTPIDSCREINESGSYYLTQDINASGDCITITADGVVLDGQGYFLFGPVYAGIGITSSGRTNVTINDLGIVNFLIGISIDNVNNSNLVNLQVLNTSCSGAWCSTTGISLSSSNNNYLSNIVESGIKCNGITCYSSAGISLSSSSNGNELSNISMSDLYEHGEADTNEISLRISGVYLDGSSDHNFISNLKISNSHCDSYRCSAGGIVLLGSNDNSFSDVEISNSHCEGYSCYVKGVLARNSDDNSFSDVEISNSHCEGYEYGCSITGIEFKDSSEIYIYNSTISSITSVGGSGSKGGILGR
jgi:hypothetical protein